MVRRAARSRRPVALVVPRAPRPPRRSRVREGEPGGNDGKGHPLPAPEGAAPRPRRRGSLVDVRGDQFARRVVVKLVAADECLGLRGVVIAFIASPRGVLDGAHRARTIVDLAPQIEVKRSRRPTRSAPAPGSPCTPSQGLQAGDSSAVREPTSRRRAARAGRQYRARSVPLSSALHLAEGDRRALTFEGLRRARFMIRAYGSAGGEGKKNRRRDDYFWDGVSQRASARRRKRSAAERSSAHEPIASMIRRRGRAPSLLGKPARTGRPRRRRRRTGSLPRPPTSRKVRTWHSSSTARAPPQGARARRAGSRGHRGGRRLRDLRRPGRPPRHRLVGPPQRRSRGSTPRRASGRSRGSPVLVVLLHGRLQRRSSALDERGGGAVRMASDFAEGTTSPGCRRRRQKVEVGRPRSSRIRSM